MKADLNSLPNYTMAAALTFRMLAWAALWAILVPYCSAFRYSKADDGVVHPSAEQDIYSAEAEVMIENDKSEEGEVGHNPLAAASHY